jgi:type I restriction enzyme, S subunit
VTWLPLKRVADVAPSNVDKLTMDGELPVRLVNYTDVYYGDRLTSTMDYMKATATAVEVTKFNVQPGDVIMTKDSETADDIGISAFVESSAPDLVCGYHLSLVRPRSVLGRYLHYAISSTHARNQLSVAATGVTRFGLRAESIDSLSVWVPTASEQRAIADYLDTETARIDALIEKKQQLTQIIQERRHQLTFEAVSGRLTASGRFVASNIPWLPEQPATWRSPLLRLVADQGTGHTPSRSNAEWWIPGECVIPWVTTGEVAQVRSDRRRVIYETRECISPAGIDNSSAETHPKGTVFLCRTASVGYSGIMGTDMATSQDFATWTCGPELEPHFLLLCVRAMRQDLQGRLATGSTHKTIYMPDIQALKIPLPPLDEQRVIVERANSLLDASFAAEVALTAQIVLFQERRQALITAAVTGDLEVSGVAA